MGRHKTSLVSYVKPSWKTQSNGNAGNSQTTDFPVLVGGDSSVSAELNHVAKFSSMSSLFGKSSQSIFSLSQMSFNYALTHDYGHNPSDNLTICVKLGENAPKYQNNCANTITQMKMAVQPRLSCRRASGWWLGMFLHRPMCSSPNSTYGMCLGILTHNEQICRFYGGQGPTAYETEFTWLSHEPNEMSARKNKIIESTKWTLPRGWPEDLGRQTLSYSRASWCSKVALESMESFYFFFWGWGPGFASQGGGGG